MPYPLFLKIASVARRNKKRAEEKRKRRNYIETTGTRGAAPAPREPAEDLRTAEANEASAARTSLR